MSRLPVLDEVLQASPMPKPVLVHSLLAHHNIDRCFDHELSEIYIGVHSLSACLRLLPKAGVVCNVLTLLPPAWVQWVLKRPSLALVLVPSKLSFAMD